MRKKLKLTTLSKREASKLKGGYIITVHGDGHSCGCGCYYAGTPGGSSTSANSHANDAGGLYS